MPKITHMMIYNDSKLSEYYVVYQVYDIATNETVFIGCCAMLKLMLLPDLRQCSLFDSKKDYAITVLSAHETKLEAHNTAAKILAPDVRHPIPLPLYNRDRRASKRSAILCHQTGQHFQTLAEVTRAHGCSQSQLCNHLHNKVGFNSVKGRTYQYVTNSAVGK